MPTSNYVGYPDMKGDVTGKFDGAMNHEAESDCFQEIT